MSEEVKPKKVVRPSLWASLITAALAAAVFLLANWGEAATAPEPEIVAQETHTKTATFIKNGIKYRASAIQENKVTIEK